MLQINGISVAVGSRWVLENVSLLVEAGQTVLVTGANGAGKTVLARAAAGLAPVSAGQVLVDGIDIRRRKARRQIGYLPQNCGLYEYLTVAENLSFFAALAGVPWRQRRKVCADLLELVGLGGVSAAEASRLTPGQRQRLALARTLAGDPRVMVLDEPMAGLDAEARADLRHLLAELAAMGKAVLIATGDPDGLKYDRRLVLSQGQLKGGEVA
jgi:ABC-2 type transport system ATP-binding protein